MPEHNPMSVMEQANALLHWRVNPDGKAMIRNLRFRDFRQAFAFMTNVAERADADDHHPEWSNVYNQVSILLTTHDVDGITEKDLDLAAAIDRCAQDFGGDPQILSGAS